MSTLAGASRASSGWLLLGALAFAPWAWGAQRPESLLILWIILLTAAAAWVAAHLFAGTMPRVPGVCALCVVALLAQGWWMYVNARGVYVPPLRSLSPIEPVSAALPGSAEETVTGESMRTISGVLAALLIACDLGRESRWRRRIWWTVAIVGSSLAAYGLVDRAGWSSWMRSRMQPLEGFPFASFNYHANAGSFLNLVLPAVLMLPLCHARRSVGITVILLAMLSSCLAAIVVNDSRAAMAVAGVIVPVTLLLSRRRVRSSAGADQRRATPLTIGITGAAAAAVVIAVSLTTAGTGWRRWAGFESQFSADSTRPILWRICWGMCVDAGAFGEGPGTFKMLFPHSRHFDPAIYPKYVVTEHVPGRRVSMWSNAHEDYLQTIIEWGWLGAAVWGALVLGGGFVLLSSLRRTGASQRAGPPSVSPDARAGEVACDRLLMAAVAGALLGVFLHATVDFPLQVPSLQLYVAMYLGLAWGSGNWRMRYPSAAAGHADNSSRGVSA